MLELDPNGRVLCLTSGCQGQQVGGAPVCLPEDYWRMLRAAISQSPLTGQHGPSPSPTFCQWLAFSCAVGAVGEGPALLLPAATNSPWDLSQHSLEGIPPMADSWSLALSIHWQPARRCAGVPPTRWPAACVPLPH